MNLAAIALAGGLGAASRYLFDGAIARTSRLSFPVGTLVINVIGSFLLGVLTGLVLTGFASPELKALLGTGFLGGFTTFSTASVELGRLIRNDRRGTAMLLALGMLLLSITAAILGMAITQTVQ